MKSNSTPGNFSASALRHLRPSSSGVCPFRCGLSTQRSSTLFDDLMHEKSRPMRLSYFAASCGYCSSIVFAGSNSWRKKRPVRRHTTCFLFAKSSGAWRHSRSSSLGQFRKSEQMCSTRS